MSFDPLNHEFARGMRTRRRVLGDAWVDKSLSSSTTFNADFQNMITRFAWHDIWDRPGLDIKTRRIIVLSITTALGRWEEFELHVRAALQAPDDSKLTPDELNEILMQSAIYAGVPAANTAFGHATPILRELADQIGYDFGARSPDTAVHPGEGREGRSDGPVALHFSDRAPRSGKAPRHTVVLSHALGCDLTMWDSLAAVLAADCRVIAFDHRGHGSSDSPAGPYDMAHLADDAARLLRQLDTGPVVWVGLSMGGMVGQELALRHPALVRALVLANTTSAYPEAAKAMWQQRIDTVQEGGLEVIADAVMSRYFSDAVRSERPALVAASRERLLTTRVEGYIGCCAAVRDVDTTARLGAIGVPVLVIAGELDQGTPVAMSQTIASAVQHGELLVIEGASHLSALEQPQVFNNAVVEFLGRL
ncbi:MAG: hydrolase [Massilia sp.]|nr:hydrolase [Massilia sp.]